MARLQSGISFYKSCSEGLKMTAYVTLTFWCSENKHVAQAQCVLLLAVVRKGSPRKFHDIPFKLKRADA